MSFSYCNYEYGCPSQVLDSLVALANTIFESDSGYRIADRIRGNRHGVLIQCVYDHNSMIAFKIGYGVGHQEQGKFYSWLGGVLPDYRRKGIATKLAFDQHQWAMENGYKKIYTKSQNRFKSMMILNLKLGFDLMDIERTSPRSKNKIIFCKKLSGDRESLIS